MNVSELFTDESAVSQVVGVVLMVGITVLLAATAASFFLGLSDETQQQTPTVAFRFEYEANSTASGASLDTLAIRHAGGDTVEAGRLEVVARDIPTDKGVVSPRANWNEFQAGSTEEIAAGNSINLSARSLDDATSVDPTAVSLETASVELVWRGEEGTQTFVLGEWDGRTDG